MGKFKTTISVLLINLAIVVCLILAIAIAAEWYLSSSIPAKDYRGLYQETSDPRVYSMRPHFDEVRQGVRVTTNSDGFRDSEFDEPDPESRLVIAVLGDSFTFGQGVSQDNTFPALLQKKLNQSAHSDLFRVWNLGVSGYNTEQEAYILESFLLPKKPDWVVVGYNLNDYEQVVSSSQIMNPGEKTKRVELSWLERLVAGHFIVIQIAKNRIGGLIRFFKPQWYASSYTDDLRDEYLGSGQGWQSASSLLSAMNKESRDKGIGFTVAVLPPMLSLSHYPLEDVHKAILSYCHSNGIDCVDVLPYFQQRQLLDVHVSPIDAHPNANAQKIFAEAIAEHLLANSRFSTGLTGKDRNSAIGQ